MRIMLPTQVLLASLALPTIANAAPATQPATAPATKPHNYARWEKEIAAYENADRESPPAKGGVLFIGSSTIRLWKTLATDFPDHRVINRGFGGSQIVDSTHFAERVIFPYEPRVIFLRAGGNDIHAGKPAEQVFAEFQAFVAKVRSRLPQAEIAFVGLSPSIARWSERDEGGRLNELVAAWVKGGGAPAGVKYVDTSGTTLDAEGKPRPELFVADKLHLSPEGYKLLAERVRPFLPK